MKAFFRSLLGFKKPEAPKIDHAPDVDELAENLYTDMLDAEEKRNK